MPNPASPRSPRSRRRPRGFAVPMPSVSPSTPRELANLVVARPKRLAPRHDHEIVRPLEVDRAGRDPPTASPASAIASDHDRAAARRIRRQPRRTEAERGQQRGAGRRLPRPAVAPATGRLLVGDRDADLGRALAQPARDDVVRRADEVEVLARASERSAGTPGSARARASRPSGRRSASTGSGRSSSNAPCSASSAASSGPRR